MLLENVWGIHFDPQTSVVESHISRLRGKVNHGHPARFLSRLLAVMT